MRSVNESHDENENEDVDEVLSVSVYGCCSIDICRDFWMRMIPL